MPVPSGLAARRPTPAVYQRATASRARLEVWGDEITAATSGTYRLRGTDGGTLSTGAVVIEADGASSYAIPSGDLPAALGLGQGYMEQWSLVIDGEALLIERPVIIARQALLCPVTVGDLQDIWRDIQHIFSGMSDTGLNRFVRTAWRDVLRRLLADGVWPERIIDVDSLFDVTRNRALFHLFHQASISAPERYGTTRDHYAGEYRSGWATVRYREDTTGDGLPDSPDRSTRGQIVNRGVGPNNWRGRRRVM